MIDEIKNVLIQVTNVLEQDNRGVQLGCYSVALVGLTIAIRRVRPFSRFRRPFDIPNHFIQERRELTGLVERIEPNGALLMINHRPLVTIPGLPQGQLPVKISGVNISGLGLSWLQTIVAGSEVKFIPIRKNDDFVQCEVLLSQITQDKKHKVVNVGESLVKIGFGQLAIENEALDKGHLTYFNRLQTAENFALRKKLGLKYYVKPTKNTLIFIAKQLSKWAQKSAKQIAKTPKLLAS